MLLPRESPKRFLWLFPHPHARFRNKLLGSALQPLQGHARTSPRPRTSYQHPHAHFVCVLPPSHGGTSLPRSRWKAPEKAKTTAAPLPHCSKFVTVSQYSITCNTAMHRLPRYTKYIDVHAASSMRGGKRRDKEDASGDSGSAGGQARSERVNAVTPIYHAPALQESYLGSLYSLLPIFSDCSREQFFCFFPLIFILFLLLYRFINTINK